MPKYFIKLKAKANFQIQLPNSMLESQAQGSRTQRVISVFAALPAPDQGKALVQLAQGVLLVVQSVLNNAVDGQGVLLFFLAVGHLPLVSCFGCKWQQLSKTGKVLSIVSADAGMNLFCLEANLLHFEVLPGAPLLIVKLLSLLAKASVQLVPALLH